MTWRLMAAKDNYGNYQNLWNEINAVNGNSIVLDSIFINAIIKHFAPKDILLAVSKNDCCPGIAIVEKKRSGFWQTFQASQSPLGLILFSNAEHILMDIQNLIKCLPGIVFALGVMQQDEDISLFSRIKRDIRIQKLEYIRTAKIKLNGNYDEYWSSRGKNIRHNLERQRKRLKEKGIHLQLKVIEEPFKVASAIEEYARLEETGWKGKAGTAVTAKNRQGRFYREILENFCSNQQGVIYQLLMNNSVVASDLCLLRDDKMVILKTAYDENIKGFSLGLLLHQEILKKTFFEKKIRVIEFYGRVKDWHTKFTEKMKTIHHFNFYRYGFINKAIFIVKKFGKICKNTKEL